MKQLPLILSALALAGVIFLVVTRNSSVSAEPEAASGSKPVEAPEGGYRLAYINTDSLVAKYEYHKGLKEQLEKKAQRLESDLARRSQTFQENYQVLESQAANLNQQQLQAAQADLMQKQQELMQYRDQQVQLLAEEEQKLTKLMKDDMDVILQRIREEQGIDFIFSLDPSGVLLYANEAHDITNEVVKRLNEEYAKRNEKK